MTIPRFDIFRIDKDGGLFWIGAADDVAEAQKLVTQQQSGSRDFILFDLEREREDNEVRGFATTEPLDDGLCGCSRWC